LPAMQQKRPLLVLRGERCTTLQLPHLLLNCP
jgi:hypothetical protein